MKRRTSKAPAKRAPVSPKPSTVRPDWQHLYGLVCTLQQNNRLIGSVLSSLLRKDSIDDWSKDEDINEAYGLLDAAERVIKENDTALADLSDAILHAKTTKWRAR
jgi:hypothetical protein